MKDKCATRCLLLLFPLPLSLSVFKSLIPEPALASASASASGPPALRSQAPNRLKKKKVMGPDPNVVKDGVVQKEFVINAQDPKAMRAVNADKKYTQVRGGRKRGRERKQKERKRKGKRIAESQA